MDETQKEPVSDESQPVTQPASQPGQSNPNTTAALTYLAGWITGLVFLLTEKENDYIRFHAAQSLLTFGLLNVIVFVPVFGWMLMPIVAPVSLVLWILLVVQAYQGKRFKLPVVGDYAEQVKDKIGK